MQIDRIESSSEKLMMKAAEEASVVSRATTDFQRPVVCLLGLPFDVLTLNQAVEKVSEAAGRKQRCFLSTPNLNFAVASLSDGDFRDSVIRSDLSVADGMPLVWLARLLGLPLRERVAGSSLFESLRKQYSKPLAVYFFGGPDGVAETAAKKLNAASTGMVCVGYQSPGFLSVENMSSPAVIEHINASKADFLVVALGAKKGQAWIERNLSELRVPVVSHLGAVVNFVAGTVTRAPTWVGKIGAEWLWRIKEEPALWRRYFRDGVALLKLMVTKVFPCALSNAWRRRDASAVAAAQVTLAKQQDDCMLTLSGAWEEGNLSLLRDAFTRATETPSSIHLNFSNVTHIDSAGIALLMLLYGHQSKIGKGFVLCNVHPPVRRVLHLFCATYLLEPRAAKQGKKLRIASHEN